MSGRGAWPFFYKQGDDFRGDPTGRSAHGLRALKRELIYDGFASGIVPDLSYFGSSMYHRTLEFQKAEKIVVDGVIGPQTALHLFRRRKAAAEHQYGIPSSWLCKLATAESGNDPVAQGFADPGDEGMMQINLPFNPSVSIEEAWDPAWCVPWGGQFLKGAHDFILGEISVDDWEGAVAAYNIGRIYAKEWVAAGKPASGGPKIGDQDSFTRATRYVALVNKSEC